MILVAGLFALFELQFKVTETTKSKYKNILKFDRTHKTG